MALPKTYSRNPKVATARPSASQNAASCRWVGKFGGSLSILTKYPLTAGSLDTWIDSFFSCLNQLHPQMAPNCLCRAGERRKRYRLIVWIKEPIQLRSACMHALSECRLGKPLVLHKHIKLARDDALDGSRCYVAIDALLFQKIVEGRSDAALLFHVISFRRFSASSSSACGVFCVFLIKACRRTIRLSWTQNSTRAIRPPLSSLRTSQSPFPSARQSGIPIGQENSTSLMSSPTTFRSSSGRSFSHSRTGSRPEAT